MYAANAASSGAAAGPPVAMGIDAAGYPQAAGYYPEGTAAATTYAADQAAEADHWPIDDFEFEVQSQNASRSIKGPVRQTLGMSATLWFSMFLCSVIRFIVEPDPSRYKGRREALPVADTEVKHVSWASPLFRPHAIACSGEDGGLFYLSDKFSIFEIAGDKMTRLQCPLQRALSDVTIFCEAADGTACRPLALLPSDGARRPSAELVDCSSGERLPLLLDDSSVDLATLRVMESGKGLKMQRLVVRLSRERELVQLRWSFARGGWEPEWYLGKVSAEGG